MIHTRLASIRFLLGFRLVLLLGILLGLGTAGLRAQLVFTWDGGPDSSYDGNWNDALNWTANVGLPGPFDTAKFDINQTYTVNVGAAVLLSKVEVTAGDLTFNVAAGRELFINTELKVNSATLRVQGSAVTARHASLTNATLRLDGGVLILTEENSPLNGLVEQGTLRVEGNGRLEANLDGYATRSNIANSASQSVIKADGGDLLVMLAPLTTQPGEERRILFSDIQVSERVWFGDVETQGNRLTFDAGLYRPEGTEELKFRSLELRRGVTLAGGILDTAGASFYFGPGFSSQFKGVYADSTIRGHGLIETPRFITLDVASIFLDGPLNFKGSAGIRIFNLAAEVTNVEIGPNLLTFESQKAVSAKSVYFNLGQGEVRAEKGWEFGFREADTSTVGFGGVGLIRGKIFSEMGRFVAGDPSYSTREDADSALLLHPTGPVASIGAEVIGAGGLTVLSTAPVRIDGLVTLAGGELRSVNGWTFGPDGGINGAGVVFGGVPNLSQISANAALSDIPTFYATGTLATVPIYFGGSTPMLVLSTGVTSVQAPFIIEDNNGKTNAELLATLTHKTVETAGGLLWAPAGMNLLGLNLSGSGELRGPVSGTGSLTLGGGFLVGDSASTTGVAYSGNVSVGAHTLTLRDADFASLGGATTIAGGTITAANGLTLPAGSTLSGFGTVAGSMWNAGTITATGGNLTMGSTSGTYFSDQSGVLNVGAEKVTLLGTSVTLGNSTTLAGGQLFAPSGFIYDTTRKVSGFGTIRTENSVGLDGTMATPTGALTVGTNVAVGTDTLTFLSNADTVLNAALTVAGGRVTATGFGLAIGGTGSVSGYGTINQPVTNAGTVNVTAGQQLTINGLFTNTGTVNPTGTLRLTAGGSLGGTFGAGLLALAGGTYALPSAWTIPTGLSVDLSGSTFAGPGALQIGTGATLRVAGGGGTVNTAVTNAGTLALAGSLVGTGTLTNQGLLRAEEILSGGNPTDPFLGVHASVGVATTNAASGTLQVSAGRALEFLGPVTNAGALDVAGTMRFGGALTNTGTATVAGTLMIDGGGTSSGLINLAGGNLRFSQGEFTVSNAATGLMGTGQVTFGGGSRTTLNYGLTNAPLTIGQTLSFAGGEVVLPGASSLRLTGVLGLLSTENPITAWQNWGPGIGRTPDLPTTLASGGYFIWNGGSVRNTVTLEAWSFAGSGAVAGDGSLTPIVRARGDGNFNATRIDGTLVNKTSTLRFEAVSQPDMPRGVLSGDSFHSNLAKSGDFLGNGTLRNEGTVYVDLGALTTAQWSPAIVNTGTAFLGGLSPSITTSPLGSGGNFSGAVTNSGSLTLFGDIRVASLTQTAGSTTLLGLSGRSRVTGSAWNIQGGTWAAPQGGYFDATTFENTASVSFGGPSVVTRWIENKVGGTVTVSSTLDIGSEFLTHNLGTIILDGPAAVLRNVGTNFLANMLAWQPSNGFLNLANLAGGTLEIRNGANLALANGFAGPADLRVGNGSTLTISGGIVGGPGSLSIMSGGVANNTGGEVWGARPVSNAGTFNVAGRMNLSNGTALTFDNLAGGVVNLTGSSAMFASGGLGSVVLTNAAGGTITKSGDVATYDLAFGNVSIVNHGVIGQASTSGWLRLNNLTNDGTLRAVAGTELWIASGTLQAGTILDGAGTFRFREGTTTLGAGSSISGKDLWIESGTVNGPGAITVRNGDVMRITGGTLGGTGGLSILSGGVANNTGGEVWGARPVSNAGTFNVAGRMNLSNGTALTFDNLAGGVVNLTGSSAMFASGGLGSVVLTNAVGGTITKWGDVATYDLGLGYVGIVNHGVIGQASTSGWLRLNNLTNDGTLRAVAGTELWIASGTLQAGTTLDGAGTFRFREGTTTLGAGASISAKDLWIESGTVNGPGTITVRSGDVTRITGGILDGPGGLSILSGGVANNTGSEVWGARSVSNAGTFNVTGRMNLSNGTALTFNNLAGGVVNLTGTSAMFGAGGSGSVVLTNAAGGTITKSGDVTTYDLAFGNVSIVNHGVIGQASTSGWLRLNNLTNDGTLRAVAGTELWIASGTLQAGTNLDGAGTFRFREGTTTLGAGASISAKDLWIESGTVNGPGAITVRSGDGMRFTGGTLNGAGALAISSGGIFENNGSGSWGARPVSNAGTFNVTGRINLTDGTALTFNNLAGGVVNLTGTSAMFGAGGSGSVVLTNEVGGIIQKTAGSAAFDLILGAGTFVNRGTVEVNSGFLRTAVALPSGELTEGIWRVTNGAQLILNGDAAITKNAATVVLTGANSLFNGLNSLTNNSGSLSLLGGRVFSTSAAFTNSGTLIVGSGSSFATSGTFTNSGTLNVLGTFAAGGGLTNLGTLAGAGAITGSLTSGGTLAPGNSPGLLAVTGNLTLLSTSQLVMELGGMVEGVSYDTIDVTGAITLAGALNVVLVNGFSPVSGASFNLIDAASFGGNFASVSLPALPGGLTWNTAALATAGLLSVSGSAIPEPSTYAAILGAVALGLAWWRRGGRRAR